MVRREDFKYCGREIPPKEEHYILHDSTQKWYRGLFQSVFSYCALRSPDSYNTCEMCDACAKRNGIVW